MFNKRKLIIATKHKKEEVIAPLFENELNIKCFVEPNYDTDILGSFTGEIERTLSPIEALRAKCLNAMNTYGYDMGVASEGSFGPHPALFFVPADEEFMIWMDKKYDIEIVVKKLTTTTNFAGRSITTIEELDQFLNTVQFPSHGVILRKESRSNEHIVKDLNSYQAICEQFKKLKGLFGAVHIETDMRAMNNPTRMQVIAATTQQLIDAIKSKCPKCATPGFMPIKYLPGLPCALCGYATKSIKKEIIGCKKCGHELERLYPNQRKVEDPQYCDYCNP
jgi:hypothetical protein